MYPTMIYHWTMNPMKMNPAERPGQAVAKPWSRCRFDIRGLWDSQEKWMVINRCKWFRGLDMRGVTLGMISSPGEFGWCLLALPLFFEFGIMILHNAADIRLRNIQENCRRFLDRTSAKWMNWIELMDPPILEVSPEKKWQLVRYGTILWTCETLVCAVGRPGICQDLCFFVVCFQCKSILRIPDPRW